MRIRLLESDGRTPVVKRLVSLLPQAHGPGAYNFYAAEWTDAEGWATFDPAPPVQSEVLLHRGNEQWSIAVVTIPPGQTEGEWEIRLSNKQP